MIRKCCSEQDHRIGQAGRDLRRCLVQPPTHNRVNSEVRPGCSGLHPARSWKPPRTETSQIPWATSATLSLSSWENSFSLYPAWPSPVSLYVSCLSPSCHAPLWQDQLCPLHDLVGIRAAFRYPQRRLCSKLSKPSSPSLSSQSKYSRTHHLGGLCWSLWFIDVFLALEGSKVDAVPRCGPVSTEKGGIIIQALFLFIQPRIRLTVSVSRTHC